MSLMQVFFSQTRKPEGFLGKLMLTTMNPGHAKLADWGMEQLPWMKPERIAELGCGGGRNIHALLQKFSHAHVDGIDYAPLSVETAQKRNRTAVAAGKCSVRVDDVSALSLPNESYDLATAFETVYFWPGLDRCFAQVYRILKPGGRFLIVHESDGTDKTGERFEKIIEGMKVYTAEELVAALKDAGFQRVDVCRHRKKPWMALVAKR